MDIRVSTLVNLASQNKHICLLPLNGLGHTFGSVLTVSTGFFLGGEVASFVHFFSQDSVEASKEDSHGVESFILYFNDRYSMSRYLFN